MALPIRRPSVSPGARTALQGAMARYQPGGGFGAGIEAGLERGRVKALASGMQGLVSAGLAGTTMAGGLGKKYEAEVAAPTRLRMEDIRAEKLSGLQMILAQMEQTGYQAGLGRQFQAQESAYDRLLRQRQSGIRAPAAPAAPAVTPTPARIPSAYAKGITPQVQQPMAPKLIQAATTAYRQPSPGPSWMEFGGERWEMGERGPARSSIIPPGLLMAGAM